MPTEQSSLNGSDLSSELERAFAPLHKRAFGVATGIMLGLAVAALTTVHLLRSPNDPYPLSLLAEYFYGYTVSAQGIVIGSLWAGLTGFVFGWFAAFVRNLAIAVMLFVTRTRAELTATRDFLDHI